MLRYLNVRSRYMVVGFNHNINYKGEVFHIQTEDSGVKNPNITTLLYRGGTIISSKRISYADIIKVDNLSKVVEELMKEQHKDMLRSLKAGLFDERAFGRPAGAPPESRADDKGQKAEAEKEQPASAAPADAGQTGSAQSLDAIILDYLVKSEE